MIYPNMGTYRKSRDPNTVDDARARLAALVAAKPQSDLALAWVVSHNNVVSAASPKDH